MDEIQVDLNEKGHGTVVIRDEKEQLGKMDIKVSGPNLTVYHTEVEPKAQGKGLAKKLLDGLVDYARKHHLQVIPLCPYVYGQFNKDPQKFADVWTKAAKDNHSPESFHKHPDEKP